MNQDPSETRLRELLWRRELTDAEQTELRGWLAAHPDAQADWQTETRLSTLLGRLPDAPMPSNFTARVMHAVEHRAAVRKHGHVMRHYRWWWRSLLPRMAMAAVVVCAGIFVHHRYEVARAAEFARSIVVVSQVESLPDAAFLQDFDAIRRLSKKPPVDEELLSLLQ
jgi:ferric-dicitrate binding protein FerR (iron transport regulator)